MKKKLFVTLLLVGLLLVTTDAKAADYNLTCTYSAGCSPSLPAFFPASEIWFPGKTLTKTVQFTNNSSIDRKVGVQASQTTTSGDVDQVIELIITKSDSTVLFSNSLYAFYGAGQVTLLNNLSAGSTETISFQATMYSTSDNEYQGMTTRFDLVIRLIDSPTPTPVPCTATEPGTPGSLSLTRVNDTEVKVNWGSISDSVTGYRVSWSKDTDTDGDGEGTRSVGKTTETNITGLSLTGYTYYFKVRAVNGCNESATTGIATIGDGINYLAPISTPILTPTTVGLPLTLSPVSAGQSGQVAGAQTNSNSSMGEVKEANVKQGLNMWKYSLTGALVLALLLFFIIKLWGKNTKTG